MPPPRSCLVAALLFAGCTFSLDRFVERHGLETSIIAGDGYRHVVVTRYAEPPAGRLHVYIEGDGIPWIRGRQPAGDPTPRNPLALRLMVKDPADAAYLGRPCYFGLANDSGCDASSWTSGRYSSAIVSSMAEVVRKLSAEGGYREIVLIGFSGGGTVARLMARQLPELTGLLTVNANLDVHGWTASRGYQPLDGSISPADDAGLPPHILHVQAVGARDRVVPPEVTESYRQRHDLVVWPYPEFGHACCWLESWAAILVRFSEELESRQRRASGLPHEDHLVPGTPFQKPRFREPVGAEQ